MLTRKSGLSSGDYISASRRCWTLKFLHTLQSPKMYLKWDVGRRAASCWALPHISSFCFIRVLKNMIMRLIRFQFLADRTDGRAYGTVLRLSVCLSVTLCIVAKRCVLEQKLLLRAYRKSYVRNRLVPK